MKKRLALIFGMPAFIALILAWAYQQKIADGPAAVSEKNDLIRVESPLPDASAQSPLTVRGQARGMWFFEASFPVSLLDESGHEITSHFATARGEWMTESFVPFEATLEFKTDAERGFLILHRDNPSGLPENDDSLKIPVRFK